MCRGQRPRLFCCGERKALMAARPFVPAAGKITKTNNTYATAATQTFAAVVR